MSLTHTETFACPYCMSVNDIEIDEQNDLNQHFIVDCHICCAAIEVFVENTEFGLMIHAKKDDD